MIQTSRLAPVRSPYADGFRYAASGIENDWMFMTRMPRRAAPRRMSRGTIRSTGSAGAVSNDVVAGSARVIEGRE